MNCFTSLMRSRLEAKIPTKRLPCWRFPLIPFESSRFIFDCDSWACAADRCTQYARTVVADGARVSSLVGRRINHDAGVDPANSCTACENTLRLANVRSNSARCASAHSSASVNATMNWGFPRKFVEVAAWPPRRQWACRFAAGCRVAAAEAGQARPTAGRVCAGCFSRRNGPFHASVDGVLVLHYV
jgi:hypothetical protein